MNPHLLVPFSWNGAPKFEWQVGWGLVCYYNSKGLDLCSCICGCRSGSYSPELNISVSVRRRQTWEDENPNIHLQEGGHLMNVPSLSHIQVPEPKTLSWGHIFFALSKDTAGFSLFRHTGGVIYTSCSFTHYCSAVFVKTGMQTSKFLYKGMTEIKAPVNTHFHQLFS